MIRKLNLLAHLARVDGRYDRTEHKLLVGLLRRYGMQESEVSDFEENPTDTGDFRSIRDRIDLLYWSLRMMMADGVIHPNETSYCTTLASKLGIRPQMIDWFVEHQPVSLEEFEREAQHQLI